MEDSGTSRFAPLGLWELDEAGTVLHYEPTGGGRPPFPPSEVIGRNFFGEIVPAAQAEEFRERLARFFSGHAPTDSFDLTLQLGEDSVRTRILLARIHERVAPGGAESILIHVRRG
jgi:hypothetical protein